MGSKVRRPIEYLRKNTMKFVHLSVAMLVAVLFVAAPYGVRGQEPSANDISCSPSCNGNCGGRCHQHGGCMIGHYGYGKAPICQRAKANEVCPIHGYGPCPEERIDLGLGLRQAYASPDRPYFGMQPLIPARPEAPYGAYGPQQPPRFPMLRSLFSAPPMYMTTSPQPPMPTYTTRGPRDFLNPNPPSIGY